MAVPSIPCAQWPMMTSSVHASMLVHQSAPMFQQLVSILGHPPWPPATAFWADSPGPDRESGHLRRPDGKSTCTQGPHRRGKSRHAVLFLSADVSDVDSVDNHFAPSHSAKVLPNRLISGLAWCRRHKHGACPLARAVRMCGARG